MVDSTLALLGEDASGRPQLQRIPTHENVTFLELTLMNAILRSQLVLSRGEGGAMASMCKPVPG